MKGQTAGGERPARTSPAARIAPRQARRYGGALLAAYAAVPALAALWGFHKGGAESAMAGAVAGLFGASLVVFDAAHLLNWLGEPRKPPPIAPPPWPHERLYWSLTALAAAAALVAATIVLGGFDPIEEHGLDGWVDGFIAGLVCAALVGFLAARLHAWLMWLRGPEVRADDPADFSQLQALLAPTLAELEAVRLDAGRHIRRRAAWLTPIGAAVLLGLWVVWLALGGELNLLAPPLAILIGGIAGHAIAVRRLAAEYERLYKARVLPRLVALFGALTYQRPPPPDLARLRRFHVFRRFDAARAEDAIGGAYRGLKLSIVQLDLSRGWGPTRKLVFRGLLIEVALKNRLTGVTAVAADAGAFGNLRDELAARNIERVGLESAEFERAYQVYATDQVMARALITPEFMERFMALGERAGFGRPLALAQDNTLLLAMPRAGQGAGPEDFFAPPSYESPASDDAVLERLYHDIQAVLRAADAAIALDDATRQQAGRTPKVRLEGDDD